MMQNNVQRNVLFLPFAFQPEFHTGVAQYAGAHDWHLNADMARTGKIPYGWEGDGIITLLAGDESTERFVLQFGVPFVDLSMIRAEMPIPRVSKDNELIGKLGARHYLDQGWCSFVFFSREDNYACQLRIDGYRREIESCGLECRELVWPLVRRGRGDGWNVVRQWLIEELTSLPKPVAVMAYNDYDAAVVMDACLAGGLGVPEDVGVLGVDNIPEVCSCMRVKLSSVISEAITIGYRAAQLLDQLMDGGKAPPEPILIPPSGVAQRESTNLLVIQNARLRRAVKVIEARLQEPLTMEELADAAGLSRRGLYNLFERELRMTPVEYLNKKRIKMAMGLLEKTDEEIGSIARGCGMPVLSTFIRQFTMATGQTPGAWRDKKRHG